jgi:hypothetical protein
MKSRKINPIYFIFGLICIAVGVFNFFEGSGFISYAPGAQSSERWGFPVHNYLWSTVSLIIGILLVISSLTKKIDSTDTNESRVICISCKKIFLIDSIEGESCPECRGHIEQVTEVLDRHPDLLNNGK